MREMEAASRLRHERCVRAYDFGGDDGHVYIAYEYVRGKTLREAIRRGELDDAASVEAAAQVLDGLTHAHRRGIVHRDVKPSNVLLEEGPEVAVRVLDFGLAQFDDADTLTAVGDVPGTLAYIAPERLDGADASVRSDVWAVGVMLWESLAGSHPFWGVPLPEVASTIAAGAPPLSSRRGDLPRRLLAAVDASLSVDPARRPTASQLAAELREAFVVVRQPRARKRQASRRRTPAPRPRPGAPPVPPIHRVAPAALAALATAVGGSLLPFWPAPVLFLLIARGRPRDAPLAAARARAGARRPGLPARQRRPGGGGRLRRPRARVARRDVARRTRRPAVRARARARDRRAPSRFSRSPSSRPGAPGAARCRPECRRPRGRGGGGTRRPAAPARRCDRLGTSVSTRPSGRRTSLQALGSVLRANPAIATTALALAIVAAVSSRARPRAARGGSRDSVRLQLGLVLLWAPSIPALGFVVGTWLLCAARSPSGRTSARFFAAVAARLDRGRLPAE